MKTILIFLVFTLTSFITISCGSKTTTNTARANNAPINTTPTTSNSNITVTKPTIEASSLSEEQTIKALARSKKLALPWFNAAQLLALRTNDEDAKIYIEVLNNSQHAIPIAHKDSQLFAITRLNNVPNPSKPFISITVIPKNFIPPSERWKEYLQQNTNMIATYLDQVDLMVLPEISNPNNTLMGLYILHEMAHAMQDGTRRPGDDQIPNAIQLREIQAYEYEFSLMEKLNSSELSAMVKEQVALLQRRVQLEPNPNDPRLHIVFGQLNDDKQKASAASLVYLKALFTFFDTMGEPLATQQKIRAMMEQGYH